MKHEVDQYVFSQSKEQQILLEQLRAIILSLAKDAEEKMSYGVICYFWHGMLVGIGTKKQHVSFYTTRSDLKLMFPKEMALLSYSGTTVHFALNQKLPVNLIKKVIKLKMKNNLDKAKLKERK